MTCSGCQILEDNVEALELKLKRTAARSNARRKSLRSLNRAMIVRFYTQRNAIADADFNRKYVTLTIKLLGLDNVFQIEGAIKKLQDE